MTQHNGMNRIRQSERYYCFEHIMAASEFVANGEIFANIVENRRLIQENKGLLSSIVNIQSCCLYGGTLTQISCHAS